MPAAKSRRTRKPKQAKANAANLVIVKRQASRGPRLMVADPELYQGPPPLTTKIEEARRYRDRSGIFRFLQKHPGLKKYFKGLRVA